MSAQCEAVYKKMKENRDAVFLPKKGDQLPLFNTDELVQPEKYDETGAME
jgi:hypothetical protein